MVSVLPILIGCTACATGNDPKVFRWQLEYDVEHGRSIDLMFLSSARDFPRYPEPGIEGETIWTFRNDKTGCQFEYITDAQGRGIRFHYISPEYLCYVERKFRGW